jgi:hypothetical protein
MFHLSRSDKFQTIGRRVAVHAASPVHHSNQCLLKMKIMESSFILCSFEVPKSQTFDAQIIVF